MGTRSYEFAKRLVAAGHEVTVLCGTSHLVSLEGALAAGIDVRQISVRASNSDGFLRRAWAFVRFALQAGWVAVRVDCDLVYATSTPLTVGLPALAAKYLRGRRMIFEVRDLWPELPKAMGIIRNPLALTLLDWFEQRCYRGADACVGLAPGIVEGIQRKAPGKRVELIPNGCDLEMFGVSKVESGKREEETFESGKWKWESGNGKVEAPIEKFEDECVSYRGTSAFRFPISTLTALFCGAHGRANGLDAVLDAAAELKRRGSDRVQLLFVGDGQQKASLQARAAREGLDNCTFLDPMPKPELARLMGHCDLGLMILADIEAFQFGTSPNKFFDYIAAGLPVLCNYPGWVSEMLAEHECGLSVPPGDAAAFADDLLHLEANRSEGEAMGERSRELAAQSFNRDVLFRRLEQLIGEVGADG